MSSLFLKEVEVQIVKLLVIIITRSLDDGLVPHYWMVAIVPPICLKGSKKDPANYQPVNFSDR